MPTEGPIPPGIILSKSKQTAVNAMQKLIEEMPSAAEQVLQPAPLDTQQAFLLYCSFSGDVEKTAAAIGLEPIDVVRVAHANDWDLKMAPLLKLKRSARPGDIERGISRAINFVQAHRLRMGLDKLVRRISEMDGDQLLDFCMTKTRVTKRDGSCTEEEKLNTRPLADLTIALEKIHTLCYLALNDSIPERRRAEEESGPSAVEIHSAIAKAMADVQENGSPETKLMDSKLVNKPSEPLADVHVPMKPLDVDEQTPPKQL